MLLADERLVRLIGVNSPELGKDGTPAEPLAWAARQYMNNLVAGKMVSLMLEPEQHDRYGRLLAHVLLPDGRNAQALLLEQGLASIVALPPNVGWLSRYQAAERIARANKRGIWGHPYYAPIPADQITAAQTGFHFVRGRVNRIGNSKNYIYFNLSDRFACMVSHSDWKYFSGEASALLGKSIEVSGWITKYNGELRLRVHHPAVLRVLN